MKQFLLSIALLAINFSKAQNFTWMHGGTVSGTVTGVYGTQGVPAPGNDPGTRHGAATWTDSQGNLWLFGGEGTSSLPTLSWLSDLWKFNVTTKEWTWVRGSDQPDQPGVYGTQGVASTTNDPGGREFAVSWTDAAGNFWLFGGDGFGATATAVAHHLNDLWKYNPTTNEWTWVSGSNLVDQNGHYGTMGTSAASNVPGGRASAMGWMDGTGNLWLFGGSGMPATGSLDGYLNDLWKYNSTSNEWTWVNGSNQVGQNGVYGTVGVTSATNFPGGRGSSGSWIDQTLSNLYVFGGLGFASTVTPNMGYLNDLWKYNISANQWTWLSGANVFGQYGQYGTLGVASTTNSPGARFGSASWSDASGNMLLFGGVGFAISSVGNLNDFWKYNATTNDWTWMKGTNSVDQAGVYGSIGVPNLSNMPGGRHYITHWKNNKKAFWLHGGSGADATVTVPLSNMNDLWVYTYTCAPDSVKPTNSASLCADKSVTLTAYSLFPATIKWYASPSGTNHIATGSVFTTSLLTAGTYSFYAEANSCLVMQKSMTTVTVNALPSLTINASNINLCGNFNEAANITVSGAATYTWSNSNNTAAFVYTSSLQATGVQNFSVVGRDAIGCAGTQSIAIYVYVCGGIKEESGPLQVLIYPNPNTGIFRLYSEMGLQNQHLIIINAIGQKVYEQKIDSANETIHVNLPAGVYFYKLSLKGALKSTGKLIIE